MYKPRTLADAVDKVARQSAGREWALYGNLLDHWTEIVGQEYARVSTPVKISFPYQPHEAQRKNGTLTVRLPKGLAMEFSFKSDLIRQRVNTYIGYDAFARITLDKAALAPPPQKSEKILDPEQIQNLKLTTSHIENVELRDALVRFGEALFKKNSPENITSS